MTFLEEKIGNWVIRRRWWIILLTLVLVGLFGAGVRNLSFSNDSRVFFSDENPQLMALEALENTYTRDDNVLIVLAPGDGNVFTPRTLAAVERLTEACWKIPNSSRVDSITNFQHTRAEADDLVVESLVENAADLSNDEIEGIRKIALSEPLLVNRLISGTGHVTAVNVNVIKPIEGNADTSNKVAAHVRALVKSFTEENPGIDVHLTGGIMIDMAFGEASKNDMTRLVPLMYVVLIVIMGVTLRTVSGTLGTLVVIVFSVFCGLGLAGTFGIVLTGPSANAPIIIMTLAVADSIHILVTMIQQMRRGKDKYSAIRESLRINLQPVFLTSLTTGIGFLTMNFSDAPPFRDLGNIVAIGIAAAFYLSILFLPALMSVVPFRIKPKKADDTARSCDGIAGFTIRRRKPLFYGTFVVMGLLVAGIFNIELDDNFIHYFDERYEFRTASDFFEENLSGLQIIEYSLDSGETNGINDPRYLKTLEEFAAWYAKQPKVVHVNALTDIMKRLNRNMHGDDPAFYSIPENRELAAQYLLLYEMSLPFGLDLNNRINVEKSSSRFTVTMSQSTSREVMEMDQRARKWLKAHADPSMSTYGTGLTVIFAHISKRNIHSMLGASFGALVLISGIIIVALRSFRLGMVSLVPNLMPAIMAFGIWGMIESRVGLALSVMVALTLGIVVDDTVHFMSKYLRGRREGGMGPRGAVKYAFNTVGNAIWVTTLILVSGFLVLSFSGFKVNSDMGLMTAITISLALVLDFFFLPTLLMKVEEKHDETENDEYAPGFMSLSHDGVGTES